MIGPVLVVVGMRVGVHGAVGVAVFVGVADGMVMVVVQLPATLVVVVVRIVGMRVGMHGAVGVLVFVGVGRAGGRVGGAGFPAVDEGFDLE
jgi:hypothetical protein